MRPRLARKSPPLWRLLARLCLVAGCLLFALATQAADILLTGAEDNPGVQSFVRALSDMRPADSVRFQPLASLPSPGKLPAATRLILLDLPSLRLARARRPKVRRRWCCVCTPLASSSNVSVLTFHPTSVCFGAIHRWIGNCA